MKQKKNSNQKAERLFEAFGDLPPQYIESVQRHDSPRPRVHPRRALTVLLTASLAILLMTFTVFAASPGFRKLLNMPFLGENTRKNTVPEGWVGIYTTDDLDAVRNDLNGNYILMNDLTFADGEFGPDFEPLAEAIVREGVAPRIICESDGTQAQDALFMKQTLLGKLAR